MHESRRIDPIRRRAFSLLETTVAVALLGIGLIMVAAIFPVALTEHRWSADLTAADAIAPRAEAILRNKIDANQLAVPALTAGIDSPWYLLRSLNLPVGANNTAASATNWTDVQQPGMAAGDPVYANLISGFFAPGSGNLLPLLSPLDGLSDRSAPFSTGNAFSPFTDSEFEDAAYRLAWYAFYRRRANGTFNYSVAVCKVNRGARFVEQDVLNPADPFAAPAEWMPTRSWRLPLPWRIRVGYLGGHQLSNSATTASPSPILGGIGLGTMAPPGSRLMVQGSVVFNITSPTPVPSGRIYTVSNVVNDTTVDVFEDLGDLQTYNFSSGAGMAFDVWLFPPALDGPTASNESPVLAWRTSL